VLRDEILRPPSNASYNLGAVEPTPYLPHDEGEGQANTNSAAHKTAIDPSQTHPSNQPRSPIREHQPLEQTRLSSPEKGNPLPQFFEPILVPRPGTTAASVTENRSED
jgi:hypothetical protein